MLPASNLKKTQNNSFAASRAVRRALEQSKKCEAGVGVGGGSPPAGGGGDGETPPGNNRDIDPKKGQF